VEVEDSDDEGLDDTIIGMIINIIIIVSTVATNRQLLWLYLIFILTVLQKKERSQKLERLPVRTEGRRGNWRKTKHRRIEVLRQNSVMRMRLFH
jgi:hypothetical protein